MLGFPETVKVDCYRIDFSKDEREKLRSEVIVEVPVNIYLNETPIATIFATPTMLKELVVGYLVGEGIINPTVNIEDVIVRNNEVKVQVAADIAFRLQASKVFKIVDSACGSTEGLENFYRLLDRIDKPLVTSKYTITINDVRRMVREMNARAKLYKRGASVHTAALFNEGYVKAVVEDVSHHNTMDKVIGVGVLSNIDFSKCTLVGTGRQSGTMVMKAARVGIPISISVRGVIHSGIRVADKTGITLMGIGRGSGITIYTHPERILPNNSAVPKEPS